MNESNDGSLVEVTRPFWLKGLHEVCGAPAKGMPGWICDEDFQVYVPVQGNSFVLFVSRVEPLLSAYAADINRIGTAAFETLQSVAAPTIFPKSTAWLIIKTYYAAFFAAHALLRIFGQSCSHLEHEQLKSIAKVAALYGNAPQTAMSGGPYALVFNSVSGELSATGQPGGPHEGFWFVFRERMKRMATEVLSVQLGTLSDRQTVSNKLDELVNNLSFGSAANGRWLSFVRNRVNYNQKMAAWFPYADLKPYQTRLFEKSNEWRRPPLEINLTSHVGEDLRRFQATCNFIISFFRAAQHDLARRCSEPRGFPRSGPIAFLNLWDQRVRKTSPVRRS
jgi:hypothetical protein